MRNTAANHRDFFLNPRQRALLSAALMALGAPLVSGQAPAQFELSAAQARGFLRIYAGFLELDVAGKGADGRIGTEAQRRLRFTLWLTSRVAAG